MASLARTRAGDHRLAKDFDEVVLDERAEERMRTGSYTHWVHKNWRVGSGTSYEDSQKSGMKRAFDVNANAWCGPGACHDYCIRHAGRPPSKYMLSLGKHKFDARTISCGQWV